MVQARIPRTVFGVLAGAALSISGALMQAITRNPIADPSILGVNTGASLFVVFGIAFLHINKGIQYIGLAFAGAALTAVLVYGLASIRHGGATPIKLALAGAAASTALQSLVNTIMLPAPRSWISSVSGRQEVSAAQTGLTSVCFCPVLSLVFLKHFFWPLPERSGAR